MKVSIETMIEEEVRSLVASFTTGNFEEEWRLDELAPASTAFSICRPTSAWINGAA